MTKNGFYISMRHARDESDFALNTSARVIPPLKNPLFEKAALEKNTKDDKHAFEVLLNRLIIAGPEAFTQHVARLKIHEPIVFACYLKGQLLSEELFTNPNSERIYRAELLGREASISAYFDKASKMVVMALYPVELVTRKIILDGRHREILVLMDDLARPLEAIISYKYG